MKHWSVFKHGQGGHDGEAFMVRACLQPNVMFFHSGNVGHEYQSVPEEPGPGAPEGHL